MTWLKLPKRQVPKPELVGPHRSLNPMFSPEPAPELKAFRRRVLLATALLLLLLGVGYLAYGPIFRVTAIEVSGTRVINAVSLKQRIEWHLDGRRWLVLPNRTLWIVSAKGLTRTLERLIRQRLSIESVTVIKQRPHTLRVVVAERSPVATWFNGSLYGTVDRHGVIIDMQAQAVPSWPIVTDENQQLLAVDSHVVKAEVMEKIVELNKELLVFQLTPQTFFIPVPTCPVSPEQPPETQPGDSNSNVNGSSNINTNQPPLNRGPVFVEKPCDLQALRFNSQEIHVQLKDGPRALFDRHQDIRAAVATLKRVLSQPSTTAIRIIDVRFGGRVYIQ